jgi:acyl-CoA thioester hydrolase
LLNVCLIGTGVLASIGITMPRVKIIPPDQFLFNMERRIGISDVNYAKHLDSIAMVKILHEARLQFLASLGFTEGNIFGLGMVVTDLAVEYRSESFANDMLVIDVGVSGFNRYGFDIGLQVTNSALETMVCNGKMGVVFFDFDKHQIIDVPSAFKALLGRQESQVA